MSTADTFTLTVRLGNDAMQTGPDVATQLRRAAEYLDDYYGPLEAGTASTVIDSNGNRVGEWRATATERQESAEQIAAAVLEAHRTNSGELNELIRAAAIDAVRAARGEL